MHFLGSQAYGLADRVVVDELDVRKDDIPVVLSLIDGDRENLCQGVIDTCGAAVSLRVVRTGGDLVDAQECVDGGGEFGGKLKSIIGDESFRASPRSDVAVDEDDGGELGSSNSEDVSTVAETVAEP